MFCITNDTTAASGIFITSNMCKEHKRRKAFDNELHGGLG